MAKAKGSEETSKKNEYDQFREIYENWAGINSAVNMPGAQGRLATRNIAIKSLEQRAETAPEDLQLTANGGYGPHIDLQALGAMNEAYDRLKGTFKKDSVDGILRDVSEKGLAKQVANYIPVKTGKKDHDDKIGKHFKYLIFQQAKEGNENAKDKVEEFARAQYTQDRLDKLEKSIKAEKGVSDKTKKLYMDAARARFTHINFRVPTEKLEEYQAKAEAQALKEFQDSFKNDAEKAQYARDNLAVNVKKLMDSGEQGYQQAAQLLYQIGNN